MPYLCWDSKEYEKKILQKLQYAACTPAPIYLSLQAKTEGFNQEETVFWCFSKISSFWANTIEVTKEKCDFTWVDCE